MACAGVTLKAVSTALAIPLKSGTVSAEGDLDFRGTLGVDKEAPVGFRADPAALRRRHRRAAGQARPVAQAHRALLRGLSDHRQGPAGGHQDAARVERLSCPAKAGHPVSADSNVMAGPCPGHPRLAFIVRRRGCAGTRPGMTLFTRDRRCPPTCSSGSRSSSRWPSPPASSSPRRWWPSAPARPSARSSPRCRSPPARPMCSSRSTTIRRSSRRARSAASRRMRRPRCSRWSISCWRSAPAWW